MKFADIAYARTLSFGERKLLYIAALLTPALLLVTFICGGRTTHAGYGMVDRMIVLICWVVIHIWILCRAYYSLKGLWRHLLLIPLAFNLSIMASIARLV